MKNIDLTNIDEIVAALEECDDAYFNTDKVLIPDAEYDQLKRAAQKMSPNHPYFVKVGADVRGGKIKLPYPMNGLDQIYEGEIEKLFVEKYNYDKSRIVISDKLDGVSCLLLFADKDGDGDAEFQIAYSRGNSVEAADITRHVKHLSFPKKIKGHSLMVVRAEIIMKDKTFRDNYANQYSSARALVAGSMNRSVTDPAILNDIDLIAYSIVDKKMHDGSGLRISKVAAFSLLKTYGFKTPSIIIVDGHQLNDKFLISCIETAKASSAYELDGIVLTENNSHTSIKYKMIDASSITISPFKNLHLELSKWGYAKPRIEINPVKLYDTVVTFATAFNAKYVYDNQIGPGSTVQITKAGSVIPYIISTTPSTVADYNKWFCQQIDTVAGANEWEWNDTGVEIVLKNPNNHPVVKFKQVLDFFESLEVDLLKESNLKTVFNGLKISPKFSYEQIITIIFDLTEKEWEQMIGANGIKIYASLHRRLSNMKLETLLGSLNFCGFGFGVRRAKILLEQLSNPDNVWSLDKWDIESLHGFDSKTASKIADGLPEVKAFLDLNSDYIKIIKTVKTDELKDVNVVFTGFRDNELEEKIEKMGGKVGSGVSKKTTYLIAADPTSNSGKAGKAKDLGVPVLSIEDFKNKYNL